MHSLFWIANDGKQSIKIMFSIVTKNMPVELLQIICSVFDADESVVQASLWNDINQKFIGWMNVIRQKLFLCTMSQTSRKKIKIFIINICVYANFCCLLILLN